MSEGKASRDNDGTDEAVDDRVPVTVLTGFLGAGKTTLLNRILKEQHGKVIAVIENEFGEVGVDDEIVRQKYETKEEIFEMNNGCICCTVRGDLVRLLGKILRRKRKLDGIIIETTGLADPAPVAQTFFMDQSIKERARLDAIITMVDAFHILPRLKEEKPEGVENESVEQVAFADKLLLNKTDLVSEDQLKIVEEELRKINALAPILRCQNAEINISEVIGVHCFDLQKVLEMDPAFLQDEDHQHDETVVNVGIVVSGDCDLIKMNMWLATLIREKGVDLFRYKGVISIAGESRKFIFQGVHMVFQGEPSVDWAPDEARVNKMIFIGRNLDREALNKGFNSCIVEGS